VQNPLAHFPPNFNQRKEKKRKGMFQKMIKKKGYVSKNDQLQCISIAVDRFFKPSFI